LAGLKVKARTVRAQFFACVRNIDEILGVIPPSSGAARNLGVKDVCGDPGRLLSHIDDIQTVATLAIEAMDILGAVDS
jgi:hypothetical protein